MNTIPSNYVNISQIAKKSGKRLTNWMHQKIGKEQIERFTMNNPSIENPIVSIKGRCKNRGTYAHPELAAIFSAWCDPDFAGFQQKSVRQIDKLDMELEEAFKEADRRDRSFRVLSQKDPLKQIQNRMALSEEIESALKRCAFFTAMSAPKTAEYSEKASSHDEFGDLSLAESFDLLLEILDEEQIDKAESGFVGMFEDMNHRNIPKVLMSYLSDRIESLLTPYQFALLNHWIEELTIAKRNKEVEQKFGAEGAKQRKLLMPSILTDETKIDIRVVAARYHELQDPDIQREAMLDAQLDEFDEELSDEEYDYLEEQKELDMAINDFVFELWKAEYDLLLERRERVAAAQS
jgi:hypothetical protein